MKKLFIILLLFPWFSISMERPNGQLEEIELDEFTDQSEFSVVKNIIPERLLADIEHIASNRVDQEKDLNNSKVEAKQVVDSLQYLVYALQPNIESSIRKKALGKFQHKLNCMQSMRELEDLLNKIDVISKESLSMSRTLDKREINRLIDKRKKEIQSTVNSRISELKKIFDWDDIRSYDLTWEPALAVAVKQKNIELAMLLVENNEPVKSGHIYESIQGGCFDLAKLLIENISKDNLNTKNYKNFNWTEYYFGQCFKPKSLEELVYYAAHNGRLDILKLLFKKGFEVNPNFLNEIKNYGDALKIACEKGYLEVAEYLLKNGVSPNQESWETSSKERCRLEKEWQDAFKDGKDFPEKASPLICEMVRKGYTDLVEVMLEAGADVNTQNTKQETLLRIAVSNKHKRLVDLLLKNGAIKERVIHSLPSSFPIEIKKKIFYHFVERMIKEAKGLDDIERVLETCYAMNNDCNGALDISSVLTLIIDKVIVEWDCLNVKTWRERCLKQASLSSAKVFLDLHNAEANGNRDRDDYILYFKECYDPQTALHFCVRRCPHLLNLLLMNGAKVDVKDIKEGTPLHLACKEANVLAVETLLNYGANVNVENSDKETPLFSVTLKSAFDSPSVEKCLDIVKVLLENGAEVKHRNRRHHTSLDYKMASTIREFLISHVAKQKKSS